MKEGALEPIHEIVMYQISKCINYITLHDLSKLLINIYFNISIFYKYPNKTDEI